MTSVKKISESVTPMVESPHVSKTVKEAAKEKIKELIAAESKVVRGMFQCFETPGSTVKIIVKKYPGIPHFEMTMTDGETYDIPLYVARHLNGVDISAGALASNNSKNAMIGTCSYAVHGFSWRHGDATGPASASAAGGIPVPIVGVAKRVKRYGFQSMEFGSAI